MYVLLGESSYFIWLTKNNRLKIWLVFALFCVHAERGKEKTQGTTKPVNKANSAAAKVTTSNGNGALNR